MILFCFDGLGAFSRISRSAQYLVSINQTATKCSGSGPAENFYPSGNHTHSNPSLAGRGGSRGRLLYAFLEFSVESLHPLSFQSFTFRYFLLATDSDDSTKSESPSRLFVLDSPDLGELADFSIPALLSPNPGDTVVD